MTILDRQLEYYRTGATRSLAFRRAQLRALYDAVSAHEGELSRALADDLGKAPCESYSTEIGFVLSEIRHTLSHLRGWMKPRRVPTPITAFPASSRVCPEPKGSVLIIAPWNYPVLLALSPLTAALSAGNCAVLKPSELSPNTSAVLAKLIRSAFPEEYVAVREGDVSASTELLNLPFDHIFFTGSPRVGRIVMAAAAEHLTPVTLELGGKSPCIVDRTADLGLAARRIVWGKFLNAGQTCVAPDYLLVDAAVREELIGRMKEEITRLYGPAPLESPDYPKLISPRHLDRLCGLLDGEAEGSAAPWGNVLVGGEADRAGCRLAPTLLDGVTLDSPVMQEEIFGPILPILTFDRLEEAIALVRRFPKPLALYLFTRDRETERRVLAELPFGGGCVNDTIMHLVNPNLPFGGIGNSGMGAYHAHAGFDAFTHYKSVLRRGSRPDIPLRYPPYAGKLRWVKRILK